MTKPVKFEGFQWNQNDIIFLDELVEKQEKSLTWGLNEAQATFIHKFDSIDGFSSIQHRKDSDCAMRLFNYSINKGVEIKIRDAIRNPPTINLITSSYEWFASKWWAVGLALLFFLIPLVKEWIELVPLAIKYFYPES